jgi:peptidoglycan-associated lipoprotein
MELRKSAFVVALLAASLVVACGPKKPQPVAQPAPVQPAQPPPAPAPPEREVEPVDEYARIKAMPIDEIERMGLLAEIHFDYDKYDIRDSDRQILAKNAEVLKKFDFLKVTVEGHCDERGSVEYNLALGERRAKGAMDYLLTLGVGADRLKQVSYGKEVPLCQQAAEDCWARNRRSHFTITGKTAK